NGERVTAFHYEESWKQALCSTDIPSEPFFTLKNAQKIHDKKKPLGDLGVEALDDKTLKIMLERPDPFFFEKLAHPLFFPCFSPAQKEPEQYNGPFVVRKYNNEELILENNPYFWERNNLYFEKVCVRYSQKDFDVLESFKKEEIDWIGAPLHPILPNYVPFLTDRGLLKQKEKIRPFWVYFNTRCHLFSSTAVRQALSGSLNRSYIVKYIFKGDIPLYSVLPNGISNPSPEKEHLSEEQARRIFNRGLRDLGYSPKTSPSIHIIFYRYPGHIELAAYLKKRWEDLFGIRVITTGLNWNQFCNRLDRREFQLAGFSDSVLSQDPLETLTRFERANSPYNFSLWESTAYQKKMTEAKSAFSLDQRNQLLQEAESILMNDSPLIPIVNHRTIYAHNPKLEGFVFDHGECIDFRWAFLRETIC
ncbi:MAG: ABC transporter substrate-binding protein, partial [Chlamydiales bacterium]